MSREIVLTLKHVANSFLMKLEKLVFTKKTLKVTKIYFSILSFFFASQEIICQIDFKREQGLWAVEPKTPRLKDVAVPQFIKAKKC